MDTSQQATVTSRNKAAAESSVAFMEKTYIRVMVRAMDRADRFVVVSIGQQTVNGRAFGETFPLHSLWSTKR